ncbi:MAG: Adenine glycosylase [Patescibacteria group bacterium]|nr:Adenine glycosylase [Patescibacteria group bacterium]
MQAFRNYILDWFNHYGRQHLPWRQNYHPYNILVSELMLQQTQVERVIPKYLAFMKQFPDSKTLAAAPLKDVLIAWQGLGYNRRAKFLQKTAQAVEINGGKFPTEYKDLLKLPGVGPYTASAITAFSYNKPIRMIETNIRTVFIYHFFPDREDVSDTELFPLIDEALDTNNPRIWYSALMDYGSTLKKLLPNPSRKSKHHTKQSTFKGSLRQTRGEILRVLSSTDELSPEELFSKLVTNSKNHQSALEQLLKEELVFNDSGVIKLAE